jgi:hypothetical protein
MGLPALMIDYSERVLRRCSAAHLTPKIVPIMSHTPPDDRPLTAKDLASIDPFHTHGSAATVEVAPGGPRVGVAMGADFPDLLRSLAEGPVGTMPAVLKYAFRRR